MVLNTSLKIIVLKINNFQLYENEFWTTVDNGYTLTKAYKWIIIWVP